MIYGMGPMELAIVLIPILLGRVVPWVLFIVLVVLAIRWFLRQERERKDNYIALKAYLERRKGRPVSMRDGRRLNYLSKEERAKRAKQMQEAQAAQGLQTP